MNRRHFLGLGMALPIFAASDQSAPPRTSAEVLKDLTTGNARFAAGHSKHPHMDLRRIHEVAAGQHPHAVVLTCSDSRVLPEALFDQGIGDLFVIRVAGNVANNDEIASCEYAVEHFNCPVLVVLGHSNCGAVTAVVNRDREPEDIGRLVNHTSEAVERVRQQSPQLNGADLLAACVKENVLETIADLKKGCPEIADRVRENKLKLVGAVYSLDNGRVTWL